MGDLPLFLNSAHRGWSLDIKKKKIQHIYFRVRADKKIIQVSAPIMIDSHALDRAIQSKAPWILKQIQKPRPIQKYRVSHSLSSGDICYFKGKPYFLRVETTAGLPGVTLYSNKELILHIKPASPLLKRQNVLSEWYRGRLKAEITLLLKKWQPIIRVSAREFNVKKMKTRWGSCNIKARRIWINFALIYFSPCFLEYVLVHELVHLLEKRHNKRFYSFMDQFIPNWIEVKKELNQCII